MKFRPTITDYIAALENPVGVFRTLFSGRDGVPVFERDLYGELRFRAGNAAAVFRYGGDRFMKLYVRPNPYLREIYDYVSRVRPSLLPRARLLRDELFVLSPGGASGLVDVVDGEWVEGETLAEIVESGKSRVESELRNEELIVIFEELCAELRAAEWAHGDLKPENIVVRPDGKMTLIDCDAMWIPAFEGRPAVELGTPPWSSRERTAPRFDKSIDDLPAARIAEWLKK